MFKIFLTDLKSGIVVFLVALPLCLGIALAQNAPLLSGLIGGVIGGIVIGGISGSRLSVSGPAAGLTSIVLNSVSELGTFELFLTAIVISGLFQILLAAIRAGSIAHYFPSAVIKGMLCAIGIILIIKQIPHLSGYDADTEGDEAFLQSDGENSFSAFTSTLSHIMPGSITIGLISLLLLYIWELKWFKSNAITNAIPPSLLVVCFAIIAALGFEQFIPQMAIRAEHFVNLPKFQNIGSLQNMLISPDFSGFLNPAVYEIAFVIALVASLETLLSLEAIDRLDPEDSQSPPNRELLAQGTGNIISGLLGGLPLTSVIVRSSVNVNSGAKTKVSAIIHGFLILISVLGFPWVLELIPLSALAAILIFTGFKLAQPKLFVSVYKKGFDQFIPFIITLGIMLFTDLLKGVTAGLIISVVYILRQNHRSPFKLIQEEINGTFHVFIKLSTHITFVNKGKFYEVFHSIPNSSIVYIDGGKAQFIDKDILELIEQFQHQAKRRNITVHLEAIPINI